MPSYNANNKRWFVTCHNNTYWFLSKTQAEEFYQKNKEEE